MTEVLRLRIVTTTTGWLLSLEARGHAAPRTTDVALDRVAERVAEEFGEVRRTRAARTILVPREDAQIAAREACIGHLLSEALRDAQDILGVALAAKSECVIAVEAADPIARSLPWELLSATSLASPLDVANQATVVRLVPARGRRAAPDRTRLTTVVIRDERPDPVVDALVGALHDNTRRHGLPPPIVNPDELANDPHGLLVLHLAGHGVRDSQLWKQSNGVGPGALMARVQQLLPRADLVVLSLCHAGEALPAVYGSLPRMLIEGGAMSCLAPIGPARIESVTALVEGLYETLAQHEGLVTAVRQGRRRVRMRALPHEGGRWHQFVFSVRDLDWVAHAPRLVQLWRPDGWSRPAPDASRLLQAARELAGRWRHGYVGLEHLLSVWLDRASPPLRLFRWLDGSRGRLRSFLSGLSPGDGLHDWSGTPRLKSWANLLPSGFDEATLADLLVDRAEAVLFAVLGIDVRSGLRDSGETQTMGKTQELNAAPAEGLECLGGPEDGRRLWPQPGAIVGRWNGGETPLALYRSTAMTDMRCSRRHLRWDAPGELFGVEKLDGERGARTLQVGERVRLGGVTYLLGVAAAP